MSITISDKRRKAIFVAIDSIVSEFYLQTLIPPAPESQFIQAAKVKLYHAVIAAAEGREHS